MTAADAHIEPSPAPEPWETVELDDDTVEQLRRLLFGHTASVRD